MTQKTKPVDRNRADSILERARAADRDLNPQNLRKGSKVVLVPGWDGSYRNGYPWSPDTFVPDEGAVCVVDSVSKKPYGTFALIRVPGRICDAKGERRHEYRMTIGLQSIDRCEPGAAVDKRPRLFYPVNLAAESKQGNFPSHVLLNAKGDTLCGSFVNPDEMHPRGSIHSVYGLWPPPAGLCDRCREALRTVQGHPSPKATG